MMWKVKEVVFRFLFGGRAFIGSFGICLDQIQTKEEN